MWQEEVLQSEDHKPWNALYLIDNALANSDTPFIKPFVSTRLTTSGRHQGSPSPNSEGSCITSLSECAGSPTKNNSSIHGRFEKMNNPVTSSASHVMDEDPDETSPPLSANNWWTSMLLPSTQSQQSPSATAIPDLDTMNWSSDLTTAANCVAVEQLASSIATTPTADCHQHIGTSALVDSSPSMGSSLSGATDNSMWSQVLFGSANNEAMQSLSVENLQDILFARVLRQGSEFLLPDHVKRMEDIPTWDFPLRSFTFQGDDMNLATLDCKHTPTLHYSQMIDTDRLSSTTCTLPDIEAWSAAAAEDHTNAVSQSTSINGFSSGLELSSSQYEHPRIKHDYPLPSSQYEHSRIKQEYPLASSHYEHSTIKQEYPFLGSRNEHSRMKQEYHPGGSSGTMVGASAPFWLQAFGADTYKGDVLSSQQLLQECGNRPVFRTLTAGSNFAAPSIGDEFSAKWPGSHSSRVPPVLPHTLSSVPVTKQTAEMLAFRNNPARHPMDLSTLRSDIKPLKHGTTSDRSSSLQYVQQSKEEKPLHDASSNLRTMGHVEEVKETASDPKRSAGSFNSCESTSSEGLFKRPRVEPGPPNLPYKQQVRKEKLGDRITALQQLVSPFGKTDTASVLLEAIGYIKFLQEQVQVLSTPYMKTASTTTTQVDPGKNTWKSEKNQDSDEPKLDLRSRGLCLVPVSCTVHVANENGADYWAPSLGAGYR